MMWTRDDALIIFRALLSPAAEQHGFSAALYGSVMLNDEGNDLDILMIPQRENHDLKGLIATLRRHMREVSDPIPGDWNRDIVVATTNGGEHIDIQVTRLHQPPARPGDGEQCDPE
jgi:hypothetical protein